MDMKDEKRVDVVALGELLIDFTDNGVSSDGMRLFAQNPGGAPANVSAVLGKFGMKPVFIGKVGDDMHGEFLIETLMQTGIDTSYIVKDKNVFTTLAFVKLSETGERTFSFARKPGADTNLYKEELPVDIISRCRIFHFGSLSLTDEPARGATKAAIAMAKKAGGLISYDPNYRKTLWSDRETACTHIRSVLPDVDLIKISDEEVKLLTDETDLDKAAQFLFSLGIRCVVFTLGQDGAKLYTKAFTVSAPAFPSNVADTTGAGDAFWGGFLYILLEDNKEKLDFDYDHAEKYLRFANTVASLCVEKSGAIPAMPELHAVRKKLQSSK